MMLKRNSFLKKLLLFSFVAFLGACSSGLEKPETAKMLVIDSTKAPIKDPSDVNVKPFLPGSISLLTAWKGRDT
jgi:hypothetical protein